MMWLTRKTAVVLAFLADVVCSQSAETLTISSLTRDVKRVESIREIKDLQKGFAQLAQFGRWSEIAELFSEKAVLQWGNSTATGPVAIETWLRTDAGKMDGIRPGSLNTLVFESPIISLSVDGLTAKGRWNSLWFMGDGVGGTQIRGSICENEYVLANGSWKISLQHFYPLYTGPYIGGWRNYGGALPIIPYHFTPDSSGIPIPKPIDVAPETTATAVELAQRIARLNDEDQVRNLQHAYGYYVDRRMWTDVVDLFVSNATVTINGLKRYTGLAGVREAMEQMGPEGLTQGILNDHPNFVAIVNIDPDGREATTRGTEIGMIGNANTRSASWKFRVFRNQFIKENNLWKLKEVNITPLITANYSLGWGNGGTGLPNTFTPEFLSLAPRSSQPLSTRMVNTTLTDLQRQLARSAAYDGAENQSGAYGYYLDDLQCDQLGAIHASAGNKESPFAGWFQTPARIAQACHVEYGNQSLSSRRTGISFHWRPQPVILVSEDGRSATLRARLLQPSTSMNSSGSFNGAMYHDQMVLTGDGIWKLWSITIDEFYWQSKDWIGGWAAADPRPQNATNPTGSALPTKYPPDVSLVAVGDREAGFEGGSGRYIAWPEIQRMWFAYRNPVSGRVPEHYWPGCVPCKTKPEWSLSANGWQEPADGPVVSNITSHRVLRNGAKIPWKRGRS